MLILIPSFGQKILLLLCNEFKEYIVYLSKIWGQHSFLVVNINIKITLESATNSVPPFKFRSILQIDSVPRLRSHITHDQWTWKFSIFLTSGAFMVLLTQYVINKIKFTSKKKNLFLCSYKICIVQPWNKWIICLTSSLICSRKWLVYAGIY